MFSENDSVMTKDDIFNSDTDNYGTMLNMITESPETYTTYSDDCTTFGDMSPAPEIINRQPDIVKKALKTITTIQSKASQAKVSQKRASPKDPKNKLNLRLNIPKEEGIKEAMKGPDSQGSRRKGSSHSKPNSSQKNYIRKSNYDSCSKKMEFTQSPYQMMGNITQNQMDIRLMNLLNSPNKDGLSNQRRPVKGFSNFMGEEENFGPSFTELSPFTYPMVGSTPPILKQEAGREEDAFATDKIVNYLSHPGRTPPQHNNNVFTFQQNELQRIVENQMNYESGYGMEGETGSSKKNAPWEFQLSGRDSCGKMDTGLPSGGYSGHRYNFDGYQFGNDERTIDWTETFRKMKMN